MHSYPLYYDQVYQKTHSATVVDIVDDSLILDSTICYPEGGGQSGDQGLIGGVRLLDTTKDDNHTIYHHMESLPFSIGQQVAIELDWERRYHFMRLHTAQHVASSLLFHRHGIQTVSVHLGEHFLTIETDSSSIDRSLCYDIEDAVNEVIRSAHPVHYELHNRQEAQALGLRRSIKVADESVRLVVVEAVDTIACGGLHVASTSEIELCRYLGQEKIRGHVRLIFTVAAIAREENRKAQLAVEQLGVLFSSPLDTLVEVVGETLAKAEQTKAELRKAKQSLAALTLTCQLPRCEYNAGVPVVMLTVDEQIELKDLGQAILEHADLALFAAKPDGDSIQWLIGLQGKASWLLDWQSRKSQLLEEINGKGGGRPPLYQGSAKTDCEHFFAICKSLMVCP